MPHDLTAFGSLHQAESQITVSVIAVDLPSVPVYATTIDTPIYINLATADARTSPATGYTAFVPYGGLKIPTLKPMDVMQIEFSNADEFWGGVNARGGYVGRSVTIWQGQVDTADQVDPDQFTFTDVVKFYVGQLTNIIRAYDVATLKVDPHPNANTIHLPRERYDSVRFRRCPPPNTTIVTGYTERVL
jgi:hypothetical protein